MSDWDGIPYETLYKESQEHREKRNKLRDVINDQLEQAWEFTLSEETSQMLHELLFDENVSVITKFSVVDKYGNYAEYTRTALIRAGEETAE